MRIGPQRPVNPDAIAAPQGYRVEALITGLTFPSAISFGPGGELYLAESGGACGTVVALPRVLRVDPDRSVNEIGRLDHPIVGVVYRQGELLIGEDGPSPRVLRVTAEGEVKILVENLPGGGDYGLSGLALDPSGALLFGLGTRTNSGVVGLDNAARGWVARHPDWADVPGADVRLAGVNYVTAHPASGANGRLTTGAFRPFGRRSEPDDMVRGAPRSGGSVFRLPADGTELERVAWGLRNPVGVGPGPDGRLFVTEGGMEERGSRPVAGAADNFWEVQPAGYYGWPDHAGGVPLSDPRFRLPGHPQPRRLLNEDLKVAGTPRATFAPRSGIGRFDFSHSQQFGFVGDALVALSGAWSAAAYPSEDFAPSGHRVVRVDPGTGSVSDFLSNRQGAPASAGGGGGLERPFDVRFDPTGEVLYVVDFGEVHLSREQGLEAYGGTGVVWRITRIRPTLMVPVLAGEPGEEADAGIDEAPAAAGEASDEQEASGTEDGGEPAAVDEPAALEAAAPEDTAAAEPEAGEDTAPDAAAAADLPEEGASDEAEPAPGEPAREPEAASEPAPEDDDAAAEAPPDAEGAVEEPAAESGEAEVPGESGGGTEE